jgi:hypothetical protein
MLRFLVGGGVGRGDVLFPLRLGWFRKVAGRHAAPDLQCHVVVERARMCLLLRDAQLRQHVQDDARLHFEFPRQLINANFTHI